MNESEHERRLGSIRDSIREIMRGGDWYTLKELQRRVGRGGEQTISAKLRDLRKLRYGGHCIARRQRAGEDSGVFEYRMTGGATRGREVAA